MPRFNARDRRRDLIKIDHDAALARAETAAMPRMTLSSAGGRLPVVVVTAPGRARAVSVPPVLAVAALPAAVALAAAVASGARDPFRLAALASTAFVAAAGAWLLGRRRNLALGAALVAVSQAALSLLGLRPSPAMLAGVAAFVLSARWLEQRTPFAVLLTGAALACAALAGWETASTAVDPSPFLVAAIVFLWTPGHVWSRALALGRGHPRSLPALAGEGRAAAAVLATTLALIAASLLLVPRLGWPYGALAVPAGACLLATAALLRRRTDAATASHTARLSAAYLIAILAGIALSAL
jgi:protoheme IX farnesyltransferase